MKNDISILDVAALRKKAEKSLNKKLSDSNEFISEADSLKKIHEIEVYHIELEMQNEELRLAKKQAAIAADRYIELYDFAPSVFITLSSSGKIEKITLRGAQMLGKERSNLFNYEFNFFVTYDTKSDFKAFFERVFKSTKIETCKVALTTDNKSPLFVQIDGIVSENGKHCYLSLTDVTKSTLAKQELIIANKELAFQNEEKEKRATELIIANKELAFQNEEKEKRAAELVIANKELAFQNEEKEKRAAELVIANKELAFQNEEKEKRAAELVIANKELALINEEIEKHMAKCNLL
jgi:hypothetical protein